MTARSIYETPTVEALRDQLRRFVDREVRPAADAWEEAGSVPREILRRMGDLGFLGIRHPASHGGSELDALATVAFAEELSRSTYGGFAITVLVHTDMASPHLARFGTPAQKDRWLPGIVSGRIIAGVAVTEPGGGSDVQALRMTARRRGGGWVLNGTKTFITNGVLGDLFFVAARTDPEAKGSRGISMFAVEAGTPGFRVGRRLDKMGWRSSDTAELVFEECELPGDALLGEENRGFYAIMENFQNERIVLGAMAVAESRAAIDLTLEHVRQRRAFGGSLWDKQAVRLRLAELAAQTEAARQLVLHAAWLCAGGRDATREVSMVKALCGELTNRVTHACQQFHGGAGYMRGTAIERMVRDARVQSIGGGATEVMLEEIAKRM